MGRGKRLQPAARSRPPRAGRAGSAPARRLGRPARLSREAILEAGVALLERAPREPLTLARIAAEVGAVPAAQVRILTAAGLHGAQLARAHLWMTPRMPHFAALEADELFEFVVDRTIAALADLVEAG